MDLIIKNIIYHRMYSFDYSKIRTVRIMAGMSSEDLAHEIGIYSSTLLRIERGDTTRVDFCVLFKAAKALGVSMDKLYTVMER